MNLAELSQCCDEIILISDSILIPIRPPQHTSCEINVLGNEFRSTCFLQA
jgi:hypothetical protein